MLIVLMYAAFNYHGNVPIEQLKADHTYEDSKFVDIIGMDVHYRVTGEGSPVLLLHGTGASLHTWEKWTEELAKDFQVISVDLPGFGLTGKHFGNDYSISSYTHFLHTFTQKIGLDSFHLAGNSLGGHIAWEFALDYPQQVKKLVLLDATGYPHPNDTPPLAFRIAQNPILNKLLLRITPRSLFVKSLKEVYVDDSQVTDELINRYFSLFLRRGNRQSFVDRANQEFIDRTADLGKIQSPTLILCETEYLENRSQNAGRFQKDIPNSKLIVYKNVGHVPMEEVAEQSVRDAKRFLMEDLGPNLVNGQAME